jgi:kanamycin kinase
VTDPDLAALASLHELGDDPVPDIVLEIASGRPVELVWRNELGGLTFRIGDAFVKWNPPATGADLERERTRLEWLAGRHPAPQVIDHGRAGEAQWLMSVALPGESAVGDTWRARRSEAIAAIAAGLWALHAVRPTTSPPRGQRRCGSAGLPPRSVRVRRWTSRSSCTVTPVPRTP